MNVNNKHETWKNHGPVEAGLRANLTCTEHKPHHFMHVEIMI